MPIRSNGLSAINMKIGILLGKMASIFEWIHQEKTVSKLKVRCPSINNQDMLLPTINSSSHLSNIEFC